MKHAIPQHIVTDQGLPIGFTPFACEDRHNTKLKILKHKETLCFPQPHESPQPVSLEAFDLMQKILVEKEHRLCTRRYELNDYTRKFMGASDIFNVRGAMLTMLKTNTKIMHADKNHRDYNGFFVYPDDADDIRHHPFFCGIPWDNMQDYNPPFVPRLHSWEDTKYFDDEGPISDIDSATSEDSIHAVRLETPALNPSCHQQESQRIVPEAPHAKAEKGPSLLLPPPPPYSRIKRPKEKKRPRDKILRDPNCGKVALQMRKDSAFIGYGYRKPRGISEVIEEALANEGSCEEDGIATEIDGLSYTCSCTESEMMLFKVV